MGGLASRSASTRSARVRIRGFAALRFLAWKRCHVESYPTSAVYARPSLPRAPRPIAVTPYRVPDPPPVPRRPRLRRHRPRRGIDANLSLMLAGAAFYALALFMGHAGVVAWALGFRIPTDCICVPWAIPWATSSGTRP